MPATKQQIRQIIADNNLNSVADVYSLLRDSFKDILQELMEAELDASLGYEKNQKGDAPTSNKRNGHSPKTLKSSMGNSRSMSKETVKANSSQSLSPNTRGTSPALKKKWSPFMQGVWAQGISMNRYRSFM